jgi:hypothetical protein
MKPRVVHCKRESYDVYIGRPEKWGNPFTHRRDGTTAQIVVRSREEAIRRYEEWLYTQPDLMLALPELRGKVLGCWCAPLACHGDVLLRLANAEPAEGSAA